MNSHDFMTVTEVAERLRVSVRTVRELIKKGVLPAVKIGREYRIARDDLERFLRNRRK